MCLLRVCCCVCYPNARAFKSNGFFFQVITVESAFMLAFVVVRRLFPSLSKSECHILSSSEFFKRDETRRDETRLLLGNSLSFFPHSQHTKKAMAPSKDDDDDDDDDKINDVEEKSTHHHHERHGGRGERVDRRRPQREEKRTPPPPKPKPVAPTAREAGQTAESATRTTTTTTQIVFKVELFSK